MTFCSANFIKSNKYKDIAINIDPKTNSAVLEKHRTAGALYFANTSVV